MPMKTLNKGFQNKAMKNGFVHVKLKTILQRQKIKGGNFPNMFFCVEGCPRLQKNIGLRPINRMNTT